MSQIDFLTLDRIKKFYLKGNSYQQAKDRLIEHNFYEIQLNKGIEEYRFDFRIQVKTKRYRINYIRLYITAYFAKHSPKFTWDSFVESVWPDCLDIKHVSTRFKEMYWELRKINLESLIKLEQHP
eukprot:g7824.t1